jgi:phosphoribosylformylglycinamidine cyclo-ligase
MSVNDMIVQGAEPLFFLDDIGTHKLDPGRMAQIVQGVADGCVLANCALLGGETAEMPDLYHADEYDLAGFAVGIVERHKIIDGSRIDKNDVVLGLASSGVHSNGFALIRAIVRDANLDLNRTYAELQTDRTLGRVLLEPTRIYVKSVIAVLHHYRVKRIVGGMAHITGSGLAANVARVLPRHLDAKLSRNAWHVPPIFDFLARHGSLDQAELDKVFNLGVGFVLIVRPDFADSITAQLQRNGETVYRLGTIVKGTGRVQLD